MTQCTRLLHTVLDRTGMLANALCERLLGTLRRECVDFLMPLTAPHLQDILHEWVVQDNARACAYVLQALASHNRRRTYRLFSMRTGTSCHHACRS